MMTQAACRHQYKVCTCTEISDSALEHVDNVLWLACRVVCFNKVDVMNHWLKLRPVHASLGIM